MLLNEIALSAEKNARVYRGATVVDGSGDPRYVADVAVEGARIVAIGQPLRLSGNAVEIDARGLALAPGFIDMHAHSDLAVLRGADHGAKLLQGVTTEVLGQDGLGYAPVDDVVAAAVATQITGWNGPIDTTTMPWRSVAEYRAAVDAATAGNTAVLVPQGNLRMLVVGHDPRPATEPEIAEMCRILGEAMDEGAFGMSSGLTYTPGMYASTEELIALCRVVAERGGYWAPHTRSYGGAALDAFREALDIGRATGCPVHLTHATMNFAPNRGRAGELLALVDAAIADGVDVTLDTYPYLPGATTLAALLPSTLSAGGDLLARLQTLTDEDREWLRVQLDEVGCDGFHGEVADWAAIEISGVCDPANAGYVGRTIADIASASGARPVDVVIDLLVRDELATGVLMHIGDEANVREIMAHPAHTGGSDGILIGGKPHPRGFGTFPRYLGHYVREVGVLSLEEAVRHLAATPARRLGLDRGDAPRGVIRIGATADLVLFDPDEVIDGATFAAPRTAPSGIREVLVAGQVVVAAGELTGATPGRALAHQPAAHRAVVPRVDATIDPRGAVSLANLRVVAGEGLDAAVLQGFLDREGAASAPVDVHVTIADLAPGAFSVTVDAEGVRVVGGDAAGALYGVIVLDQLREPEDVSHPVPFGSWSSAPAYEWRGLMLDVARHFRPVEDVLRIIDLLARHRMNVFHLHLTDDQGWRFEVPGWPLLTTRGGVRSGTKHGHGPLAQVVMGEHRGWYTAADLRRIDDYAAARGITVVPEAEFPGHVQAALAAYPDLGNLDAAAAEAEPWHSFGLNPHTLNLEEGTLQFARDALDVLIDCFRSELIGIGGDEVPTAQWAASPRVGERMAELGIDDIHGVQPWYTAQLAAHLASRGRRAFAWDEVLAGPTPDGVVIAAWRGPVAAEVALERGFECVACPDMMLYLDYRQSESLEEPIPVGPPLTLAGAWQTRIPDGCLGGQANLWTEHIFSRDRADFALFPRLSAIAERLWLGGAPGDLAEFESRLAVQLRRLAAWGVAYRPLDGPRPEQRLPGVPGSPRTLAEREAVVAELVADLRP